MVATRAADGGCGAGYGDPPFALQGGHPERRPKGPGDSHQHQGVGTAGVGHRPSATGSGPAAHRGPDGRRSVASDFRLSTFLCR